MASKISVWSTDDTHTYIGIDSSMKTIKLTNDEAKILRDLLISKFNKPVHKSWSWDEQPINDYSRRSDWDDTVDEFPRF